MMRFYFSLSIVWTIQSVAFAADEAQKILSLSPDRKYAMRILYEGAGDPDEKIDSTSIHKMQLVTHPAGKFVASLLPENDVETNFTWFPLLWSRDSRWVVFYTEGPRVGVPRVFRKTGTKFVLVNKKAGLEVYAVSRVHGATSLRNEFVKPLQWLKPGRLVTDQTFLLRMEDGETTDARFVVTSAYREKAGKFQTLSAKAKAPE